MLGIPREKLPIAVLMIALLAFLVSSLQGRFETADVRKGIALAMQHKPDGAHTVFELLAARGEGDPQCDGKVLSQLLGDVDVRCATPRKPAVEYEFRVLLDGKKPPRPANGAAEALFARR